jgi:hypothetical protein
VGCSAVVEASVLVSTAEFAGGVSAGVALFHFIILGVTMEVARFLAGGTVFRDSAG